MEKSKLEKVQQEKYIGVIMSNNLSWLLHPKMISCGTNPNRTFLQTNHTICNRDIKLQCWKTYVVAIIEYPPPSWDANNKNFIQKVQRKAARFILNVYDRKSSVSIIIKELNLDSI